MSNAIFGIAVALVIVILSGAVEDWGSSSWKSWIVIAGLLALSLCIKVAEKVILKRKTRQAASRKVLPPVDGQYSPLPTPSANIDPLDSISEDEKALLSWAYHSEHPYFSIDQAMGCSDHIVVGQKSIYPWKEEMGLEPKIHKDLRTHWIAIAEQCIRKGFARRCRGNLYELTGEGTSLGKRVPEPRFVSKEALEEVLSDFYRLTDGLPRDVQQLLLCIKKDGHGRVAVFHEVDIESIPEEQKLCRPYIQIGAAIMGDGSKEHQTAYYQKVKLLSDRGHLRSVRPTLMNSFMSNIPPVGTPELLELSEKGRETSDLF